MSTTAPEPLIAEDWRIPGRIYRDDDIFEAEMRGIFGSDNGWGALLSHFSYEERELVEPLARHGFL